MFFRLRAACGRCLPRLPRFTHIASYTMRYAQLAALVHLFAGFRALPGEVRKRISRAISLPGDPLRMTEVTSLSHLKALESESIEIFREVAASFERPVMMYSIGKDSSVLLHLARKAFYPSRIPFPLLHIDTGHNFPEVIAFRDSRAAELGERLIVRSVEDSIASGRVVLKTPDESRNVHQSVTLLDAIAEFEFDA